MPFSRASGHVRPSKDFSVQPHANTSQTRRSQPRIRPFPGSAFLPHSHLRRQKSADVSRNRLLIRLLTQPVPPASGLASLLTAGPASGPPRPTTSTHASTCGFSADPRILACRVQPGQSPPCLLGHGPPASHPARSCSVPWIIFPKHSSNWLKKRPSRNQKRERPFHSSLLLSAQRSEHCPVLQAPGPLVPAHVLCSSCTSVVTSLPLFTLSPQLRVLPLPE